MDAMRKIGKPVMIVMTVVMAASMLAAAMARVQHLF
jgi:hypothetical protein